MIGGQPQTVYFVVFVLSLSRLMHLSYSLKPINTSDFICMHDAAFRYFGGQPEELVYDQTKLVVINEKYRELALNQEAIIEPTQCIHARGQRRLSGSDRSSGSTRSQSTWGIWLEGFVIAAFPSGAAAPYKHAYRVLR